MEMALVSHFHFNLYSDSVSILSKPNLTHNSHSSIKM